ncbi:hypothetical protein PR202_gb21222 [Eleusine coracana subsp. coracana]|uniref:MIF4G domain-containing protein n=1 Tax=Eleusine coracana subsp. coracana TaxID=191504 RepID=A0AAV5FEN1_ELECO|nr:hypothetical protein PR202_gb21222 [Eleusine coracana subsp. coracana]
MGYVPSAAHQFQPQLGSIASMPMAPQYAQQPNKYVAPRKAVKITHPDTHEELKLDKRMESSGQRASPNLPPQSQTVGSYMGFYNQQPNSYNQSAMYYPPTTSVNQVPTGSSGSRLYPVTQSGQTMTYVSPSVGPSSSGQVQSTVKPYSGGLQKEKSGANTVTISAPPSKSDEPKSRPAEDAAPSRQKDNKVVSVSVTTISNKSDHEKRPAVVSQSIPIQATKPETTGTASPVVNSVSSVPTADGKNKEAIQRTGSFKDIQTVEDLKVQTSVKDGGDGGGHLEAKNSKELDSTSSSSYVTVALPASITLPGVGATEVDSTLNASDVPGTDRSSAKPASGGTGEPQGVESSAVSAAEHEKCIQIHKDSADSSMDNISSDVTDCKSPEVCISDMSELASAVTSNTDNPDAAPYVTDQEQLQKDSALSVSEEQRSFNNSSKDSETSPDFLEGNAVATSETTESTVESAKGDSDVSQDTGQVSREKPSAELARTKSTAGKKKKRKEMLSKADAAGSSDLYNAYKGPEEKVESISTAEVADGSVNATPMLPDESEREINTSEDDGKKKVEPDDWEDAAEMSTPKLQSSESGNQADASHVSDLDTTEANGKKKYSRDFLLTLSQHCTDLPVGFQMSDAASALMNSLAGKSYVVDREPHHSPGRGIDRPASRDRRGGAMADDRWTKIPLSPGRDAHMDLTNGPSMINYRGAPGVNHGVLRNPRGQPSNQYGGGLLGGPVQSVGPQMSRSGSDADRWQQRGLMPSPVTPMQTMHKAERKYVVGKISDEEEAKQRQLKGILNKLTPQNFERLFEQVKDVNIDSVATLTGVISQIFDKALMEPTFCEMYADFCSHLASALPDFNEDNEKITFKRLLLNKCQEEFERGEREEAEADKTEEEGNFQQDPDEENIEALCKLMSTIGEMIDHPKAKEHMDAYFDIMHKLSTSQKLSSRVRFMLRDSIDLRRNKWQQRRKVEGPKKIEEVHRDAAQERHAQTSRLGRGPVSSGSRRGGPPMDYGARGSAALASPNSQQGSIRGMPPHSRGFGSQDIRTDERHQFDGRTVPLPQRPVKDEAITLGPQGGLARGMSIRGQPLASNAELPSVVDHRRMVSGSNGFNSSSDWTSSTGREDPGSRTPDRTSGRTAASIQSTGSSHRPASQEGRSGNKSYSDDDLRDKSVAAIREYYRLASVLASLEDTLSDAPRATEYLGRLLARFVQENILLLQEVGRLIQESGEEPGCLVQDGIGADILAAVLESIKLEKGDSFLNETKSSSNLKFEDFRPQHLKRSKLDAFM